MFCCSVVILLLSSFICINPQTKLSSLFYLLFLFVFILLPCFLRIIPIFSMCSVFMFTVRFTILRQDYEETLFFYFTEIKLKRYNFQKKSVFIWKFFNLLALSYWINFCLTYNFLVNLESLWKLSLNLWYEQLWRPIQHFHFFRNIK